MGLASYSAERVQGPPADSACASIPEGSFPDWRAAYRVEIDVPSSGKLFRVGLGSQGSHASVHFEVLFSGAHHGCRQIDVDGMVKASIIEFTRSTWLARKSMPWLRSTVLDLATVLHVDQRHEQELGSRTLFPRLLLFFLSFLFSFSRPMVKVGVLSDPDDIDHRPVQNNFTDLEFFLNREGASCSPERSPRERRVPLQTMDHRPEKTLSDERRYRPIRSLRCRRF